ncbi:DUF305 domain-containing protein [Dorea sp. D27]|uniref:DUF305 domain-containing protein n=1 Tax=Dorea sp. D27 TaxID=658665 RepID=UPI0006A0E25F|nr:DUF305 domain-containing protein [Dorea sp. D27]KMZ54885.1 putative lipoprotein [Dorea sp. D27]
MNKKTIYWTSGIIAILIIILLIIWAAFGKDSRTRSDDTVPEGPAAEEALGSYMEEQDILMNKMMEDMEDVQPAGNAALDFLNGMIPHHEAAVSMSESYLKYGGEDAELKKLAEYIVRIQKEEIAQMQSYIEDLKKDGTEDPEQEQAYLDAYGTMLSAHHSAHSSHETSANVETAFAEGMIMHHQMAVDMAQAIVGNTDNEKVTALAENIIEAQQNEITQMQEILKRLSDDTHSHH